MSDNDTSALCNGSGPYPHWPSPSMTQPSPEAVAKAMDYAVVVARDMKRRAARGTHPDMPSETCIDTLAAHVATLTSKLKSLQARLEDVSAQLEAANNAVQTIAAKSDHIIVQRDEALSRIVDLQDELETAEARAAAMEAALEEISGHAPVKTPPDYATSSDTGEAFDDGYSRGVWEMGQIADAALAPQAEAGEPG